jgi:hypothetical protein
MAQRCRIHTSTTRVDSTAYIEGGATEQIVDPVELLTAIIEASIALIGFSGLVIVLGPRFSGDWELIDKDRLVLLLALGMIALACTLFSLVLLAAGFSHARVWALSSVAWVVLVLPFAVWSVRRVIQTPDQPTRGWTYVGVSVFAVIANLAVQVATAAYFAAFWPLFLALAVSLILGVMQFVRLLWFGLFR